MTQKELRELDAWIAEHVIGFVDIGQDAERVRWYVSKEIKAARDAKILSWNDWHKHRVAILPSYTEDPAAAMEVLKKCCEKISDEDIEISHPYNRRDKMWSICNVYGEIESQGKTLELAICLFAKKLFMK